MSEELDLSSLSLASSTNAGVIFQSIITDNVVSLNRTDGSSTTVGKLNIGSTGELGFYLNGVYDVLRIRDYNANSNDNIHDVELLADKGKLKITSTDANKTVEINDIDITYDSSTSSTILKTQSSSRLKIDSSNIEFGGNFQIDGDLLTNGNFISLLFISLILLLDH